MNTAAHFFKCAALIRGKTRKTFALLSHRFAEHPLRSAHSPHNFARLPHRCARLGAHILNDEAALRNRIRYA